MKRRYNAAKWGYLTYPIPQTTMQNERKQIALSIGQAFADNNLDPIWKHFAADVKWTWYGHVSHRSVHNRGHCPKKALLAQSPFEGTSTLTIDTVVQEGETVICTSSLTSTLKTGEPYSCVVCDNYHFEFDLVKEVHSYTCIIKVEG